MGRRVHAQPFGTVPTPRELDDLELLGSGALTPLTGFNEPGSPVTLTLPDDVLAAAAESGQVELVDPEGLPLARVTVADRRARAGRSRSSPTPSSAPSAASISPPPRSVSSTRAAPSSRSPTR